MRREFGLTAVALAALLAITGSVSAQKKAPAKKAPSKKTTPPPATKIVPPLDVRAAREKVEVQHGNVTLFVDKLGPIVQSIETLDESARTKRLPQASIDKNEKTKQGVVAAIRNLKQGIANLESEFRTKEALQKYLPQIEGITDLVSRAEDSALAGKFVASKDPLREVVKKLNDALAALPL
jgi:hypothetical protein